jgi:hypothetical protein
LAYGIGGLTPAEFGDLTPFEFVPYINARMKWHEEQTKMENDRIGLICATLQNGIPTYTPTKKISPHQPKDYFHRAEPVNKKPSMQTLYDKMRSITSMFGGKR